MLLEGVVMNAEETRLPSRGDAPAITAPAERRLSDADEMPPLPIAPRPVPWRRMFPSL